MRRAGLLAILLLAVVAGTRAADPPPADDPRLPRAPLNETVLSLAGDPLRPVTLQVTLFTPTGAGPFPLAVMNHGATNVSTTSRGERYRFTAAAYYFLSRGYAVALPMMRGFAGSGGSLAHAGCDLAAVAQSNARDLQAVIEALAGRPEIDRTRIIVAGQSFGAWNALGLATMPPAGVRGIVSFNAALRASDCPYPDNGMIASAGRLGAQAHLPSLWFYGDNDSIVPTGTWRAMVEQYTRAGGRAELVPFGRYGSDAHQILSHSESLPLWSPKVDGFLARLGLPAAPVQPDYLPYPIPSATRWAALGDAAVVPFLAVPGRAFYQRFLEARDRPRAFVIAPNGMASQASGGYDPLGYALRNCGRMATGCQLYAVNDDVVWKGPSPGAVATVATRQVARAIQHDTSTPLGAFYAVNRDCSLRGLPKVIIAEPPAHGIAIVDPRDIHPTFPPEHPYAACNAVTVSAMGVTYMPSPGYAGTDALTIEETSLEGRRQRLRIELRVM